jgi:hypothetical protein
MRGEGHTVEITNVPDLEAVKVEYGIPEDLRSCHTAIVDGYVIEGHIPAEDVERLLAERPDVIGLAVPGMPIGSPGMEVPGRPAQPYSVIAFAEDGSTEVFANH